MDKSLHDMRSLFAQLGRPSDDRSIARFIETYGPLPAGMQLHEASFWTYSQACFLREAISDDADWAIVTDELNMELHARH